MAAITSVTVLYTNDGAFGVRTAVFAVRKVTTGDTLDVSVLGNMQGNPLAVFSAVYSAAHVTVTNRAQAGAAPGIGGTVLTFNEASLASDGLVVTVVGQAPQ